MSFFRDLNVAFHSLMRSKSLAAIVILTLALGIGANAAIFTLVRGVLLKPLVNRDENRLIYIRQSAPTLGEDNTTFSVPEIRDIEPSIRSVSEFGDFSRGPRRRRQRKLLRCNGSASYSRPSRWTARRGRRRPRRHRPDRPFLVHRLQKRPERDRQDRSAQQYRRSFGYGYRRPGTLCALPRRDRNYRQPSHQPASSFRHHGHRPRPSHDRTLR
jgi:hypothetical protein